MKANELMIGDWIKFKGRIVKVDNLRDDGDWLGIQLDSGCSPVLLARVEPIPITADILEKNGFLKHDCSGYPEHHMYELPSEHMVVVVFGMYDCDFSFNINSVPMNIRFVHELQHALKLCKVDKKIEV